jgi:hypothetical protein
MRGLIAPPVVVILVAFIGFVSCKALGANPGNREMCLAGGIVLVATVTAVVPLIIVRRAKQYAVSQAALVGTVLHLMVAIGVGGVVYLKLQPATPYLIWLSGLYGASLIAVVVCSVQAVRSAEPELPVTPKPSAKD